MNAPAVKPKHRRHWRIVRHTVGSLVLLILLAVLGGLWVLRNLDTSLVKSRLRNLVRNEAGLEPAYRIPPARLFAGLSLHPLPLPPPPDGPARAPTLSHDP